MTKVSALALAGLIFIFSYPSTVVASEFRLGFAALAAQIGPIAGTPIEDEIHGPNGDGLQRTTTGLMVWRKADNWTAFTNGSRTWVNGPLGVQERGNNERFPWEFDDRPAISQVMANTPFDAGAEEAALSMINGSRSQLGLPALAMDGALRQVARAHSKDMGDHNYFAHNTLDGKSPFDRIKSAGINFGWAAENLGYAQGYASNTEAVSTNHRSMMAEVPPNDGHRENILNPHYRKVGIGVYRTADGRTYYTCDFTD